MVRQTGLTGAQNIVSLCNVLSDQHMSVSLLLLDGSDDRCGLDPAVRLISVPEARGGFFGRLSTARHMRNVLIREDYDIVYLVDSWTIPALWLATLGQMRVRQKCLVYHTFDWLEPGQVGWWNIWFEKKLCRKADLVVNTDRSRARMQRTVYGLDETPLSIQNALLLRTQMLAYNKAAREKMLARPERNGEKIVIYPTVVSGAASAERMGYELIESMALVDNSFSLVLFGHAGAEYERCLELVCRSNMGDRVRFLEPVCFDMLLQYVSSADYGVIFYNDEKSSGYFMCNADKLSLYAACGVPYLASSFPNLESITYKHQMGICCNSNDIQSIAKGLNELRDRFPGGEPQRLEVRSVFEKHICLERNIDPLIKALNSL